MTEQTDLKYIELCKRAQEKWNPKSGDKVYVKKQDKPYRISPRYDKIHHVYATRKEQGEPYICLDSNIDAGRVFHLHRKEGLIWIIDDLEQIGELIEAEGWKYLSGFYGQYYCEVWKGVMYKTKLSSKTASDELTARMAAYVKILDMKEKSANNINLDFDTVRCPNSNCKSKVIDYLKNDNWICCECNHKWIEKWEEKSDKPKRERPAGHVPSDVDSI